MNQKIDRPASSFSSESKDRSFGFLNFFRTVFDGLVFLIYRYILVPTVVLLLHCVKSLLPKKVKETVLDRENLVYQPLPSRPIWIHAASGEIEYAKSVIREVRKIYPQTNILVTYFSPSGKSFFSTVEGVDLFLPLPFDHRHSVAEFLRFYRPLCALFARTDVWPELSFQIRQNNIPSLLFSATFAENSPRLQYPGLWLNRWALNHLTNIFCVSAEDSSLLLNRNILTPIYVSGDTRYDQVFYRLQNPTKTIKFSRPESKNSRSRILVMGSTWPEDEEVLLPALKLWLKEGHRAILVPHEVTEGHLKNIQKLLRQFELDFDQYSQVDRWTQSVLLVDEMGYLQEFYKWGDIAFVGGSFRGKIHSVMEALCLGLPVLTGPYYQNNREAVQMSRFSLAIPDTISHPREESQVFAVTSCKDTYQFFDFLKILSSETNFRQHLLNHISAKKNATFQTLAWIQENLKSIECLR